MELSSFDFIDEQQVRFEVSSVRAATISVSLDNFKVMAVLIIDYLQQGHLLTSCSLCLWCLFLNDTQVFCSQELMYNMMYGKLWFDGYNGLC